jgi:hypothetical protein
MQVFDSDCFQNNNAVGDWLMLRTAVESKLSNKITVLFHLTNVRNNGCLANFSARLKGPNNKHVNPPLAKALATWYWTIRNNMSAMVLNYENCQDGNSAEIMGPEEAKYSADYGSKSRESIESDR